MALGGMGSPKVQLEYRRDRSDTVAFRSLLLPRVGEGEAVEEEGGERGPGSEYLLFDSPQTEAYKAYGAFEPARVIPIIVSPAERDDRRRRREQRRAAKAAGVRWAPKALVSDPQRVPDPLIVVSPSRGSAPRVERGAAPTAESARRIRHANARSAARRNHPDKAMAALESRVQAERSKLPKLVVGGGDERMHRHINRVLARQAINLEIIADDEYY